MKPGNRNRGPAHNGFKHGFIKTPTYRSWIAMRSRCVDPNASGYKNYGGRGIKVCERWDDFLNFLADMGERPPGMSIEREDGTGNYCPENCKWATRKVQNRNKRNTKLNDVAVADIRELRLQGRPLKEIAHLYRITVQHAGRIADGKNWQ
jgi:hypothetical protein